MDAKTSAKRVVLRVFPQAGDVRRRWQRRGSNPNAPLQAQMRQLTGRVAELEVEMQEARRLNKRIAELTDVVAQVLLPVDQRDDDAIRARLSAYVKGL